ncbi:unnamed protein product [Acanthoscelides obtectus]|uniref:Reverse transcriptase domain-containing protein n=1 Tax=Acanthoscelides obtectus TaxID=200917 RepID=A0A9P0NTL9_ACAOB|nr:unnamed protein product [Acanthoscelides obtectus]CAK1671210.1 hypothetical protein AOBTE_LOCUS28147 [Acanthoscelides obtectus]
MWLQAFSPKFLKPRVVPIFKNGEKDEISNYRTLSILSAVLKILERAIFEKIIAFLKEKDILAHCQHGSRKQRNVQTAILQFISKLYECLDKEEKSIGLFMDLS